MASGTAFIFCLADMEQAATMAASATCVKALMKGPMKKMLAAQKREREQLLKEMVKMRGLMPLLMKTRNGERWTSGERAELQEQMRALAHLSPYLVIMILPGSFAALPVLAWWLDRRRQLRDEQTPV